MDYDTRKRLLFSFLISKPDGVLLRYKRPEHLSDDAARGEINDLVEDMNSKIPDVGKDQFFAVLERFRVNLRQLAASRSWPTIPQCMRAIKSAVEDTPVDVVEVKPFSMNEVNANRIKAGEPVGDYWVFGSGANKLLARGLISQSDLDQYAPPDEAKENAAGGFA